jgi:chromosome segregation ATPase
MSRISDTRIRTRQAAARLLAAGRAAHELTVDLIYAEIRQGSRTTINDELKLWKDEQIRVDALNAALPPAVANAMLSVWALAVEQGEELFAQRGEELEKLTSAAVERASSQEVTNAELQAEIRVLCARSEDLQARLDTALAERATTQLERDNARREAQAASAARDALQARLDTSLRAIQTDHLHELETLREAQMEHEDALRSTVDQAMFRLEGVQKHVMLQAEQARDAQRRVEAELSKCRQRNDRLAEQIQQVSADAGEHRRLAEKYESQLGGAISEARDLRRDRDDLSRQVGLLQGQLAAKKEHASPRRPRRTVQKI